MQLPNGETLKTTLISDFEVAEKFGAKAVQDTYNRVMKYWGDDYEYVTELYIALNWGIWRTYESSMNIARLYEQLWGKVGEYVEENFNKEELAYFFRMTD